MRVKMSKPPPPTPTASAIGPCPTVIKIVGRPGTGSLPSTTAPPDQPLYSYKPAKKVYGVCSGWMDDLRSNVLSINISVISGQWADDNGSLCAMEPRLRLRRLPLELGSNPGRLDQWAIP